MLDQVINFINENGGPGWVLLIGTVLLLLGISKLKYTKKKMDLSEFYFDENKMPDEELSGREEAAYTNLLNEDKKKYDELMNFSFDYSEEETNVNNALETEIIDPVDVLRENKLNENNLDKETQEGYDLIFHKYKGNKDINSDDVKYKKNPTHIIKQPALGLYYLDPFVRKYETIQSALNKDKTELKANKN